MFQRDTRHTRIIFKSVLTLWMSSALCPAQTPAVLPVAETTSASATQIAPTTQLSATPLELGDALMAHQRYQAAIAAYKEAPQGSAETWNKMGIAYQLMFNTEDAGRCYRMAMRLDPTNAIVQNNIGSLYVAQKEYSLAEKYYRKAVKLNPRSALFHKNLGTALLAEHKYKKGWEAYQAALAIDPEIFTHNGQSVRMENPSTVQERGAMNYYMAKGCVRAGMTDRAVDYLRLALNEGFVTPKKVLADSEFAGLLDVPAFQQLMVSQGMILPPQMHPPVLQ